MVDFFSPYHGKEIEANWCGGKEVERRQMWVVIRKTRMVMRMRPGGERMSTWIAFLILLSKYS